MRGLHPWEQLPWDLGLTRQLLRNSPRPHGDLISQHPQAGALSSLDFCPGLGTRKRLKELSRCQGRGPEWTPRPAQVWAANRFILALRKLTVQQTFRLKQASRANSPILFQHTHSYTWGNST